MNPVTDVYMEMYTPNDVKCFIAAFSASKENAKETLEFLDEYTKKYYDNYTKNCIDKGIKIKDFNETEFEFESNLTSTLLDGTQHKYVYKLKVEDNKYTFTILDGNTNAMRRFKE